jgi:hypothetical protein
VRRKLKKFDIKQLPSSATIWIFDVINGFILPTKNTHPENAAL